ncbi:MAG: hypothetical protein H7338_15430 [Candidatus Sericytochromatia bacterium]|nr:hypothetical protein [Candidatus Sericytochromatia bacterium]
MSPFSTRRKRGLLIGLGLMSAAALVAFGTSRVKSRREPDPTGQAVEAGSEDVEAAPPTLWERAREMTQAAYLLVTQRRPNDS